MTARQEVLQRIDDLGLELDDYGERDEFLATISAPPGVTFVASGCHVLAFGFLSDRPAGWRAALDDLQHGVEPCDQQPCDVCEGV